MKRVLDIIGAGMGLVLLAPLLGWLAWRVRREMGSPVIFRQVRPGRDARPFEMVKFRTMRDAVDTDGTPLPDAERLTDLGRWLRATSLDELPELWNVLKGDMSLVGPRPLLMAYVPLYTRRQARRMNVRPGITGWAQINGRNAISWDDRFELDVWYIENRSLALDLRILRATFSKVIGRDGISAEGEATMQAFTGSNPEEDRR